jgi:anti-sigma regulatory factor (Ser/Thr protein kinase)
MNRPLEALREELPALPSSVGRARRLLRGTAGDDLPEELVDAAELLVSEVVSNAVVHAGTPVEIRVSVTDATSVHVAVSDGSPHHPVIRHHADTAGTGRGLRLLTELADDWGVSVGDGGKTVWFRISTAGRATATAPLPARVVDRRVSPGGTLAVQLRHLPLFLHVRWQETASAVLREYLLVTMDDADADEQLQRHAECSDALAILAESVPEPPAVDLPQHRPDDIWTDVTLEVPDDSVASFAALDSTLECALRLADTDQLLTNPTDPEMRAFRHWVCTEVREQAGGRPPTPWRGA